MKLLQNTNLLSIVAITLILLFLSGCGTDYDDHDETPVGIVLSVNETDLAMQDETTVIYYPSGNHIELNQGTTLGPILVEFITEDGDRYLPHSDEGFSLKYTAGSSNMITLAPVSGDNEWTFQLTGNAIGKTSISFELMHNGHADFQSTPFQVHVVGIQQ